MSETTEWRSIVLSTNGKLIEISQPITEISHEELMNLFYAALEEIPPALIAMQLALEKYSHKREQGT